TASRRARIVGRSSTLSGGRCRVIQRAPSLSSMARGSALTRRLAALERRLALLQVRGQALARVLGLEELLLQLALQGQRLGEGGLRPGVYRPLDEAHGAAGPPGRQELARPLPDRFQERLRARGLDDLVHDP